LYYNWGNALYRQARLLLDSNFPATPAVAASQSALDPVFLRQTKQIIRQCLSDAASKYCRALEIKHNFNRAIVNWVKVLKALAELNKKFNAAGFGSPQVQTMSTGGGGESFLTLELRRFLTTFKAVFLRGTRIDYSCSISRGKKNCRA